MADESKVNESLARSLERLENVLERLETRLDKLEAPDRERGMEERDEERAGRREEREAERAEREAEKEAERADRRAERGEGRGPRFGSGFPFDTDFPGTIHEVVTEAVESVMPGRESQRTTRDFKISNFTGIEIGGAFAVEIVRSDSYSVSITAEDELFKNLDVSKDGATLRVGHSRHIGWRAQISRPRARISLPVLKELRLSGATRATISGFSSTEAFKMNLSGASGVSGDITAGDAEFELSGASHARLAGSAKDVIINSSGAVHVELGGFSVHNASVKLSGASHTTVKMDGRLDARLSGVSHFSWIGNPTMGNIRTSGASVLSKQQQPATDTA